MTAKKFQNKNYAINAKWTSSRDMHGWRQFWICERRYDESGVLWVEMMAVCDRTVRFWIPASDLEAENETNRLWQAGWK